MVTGPVVVVVVCPVVLLLWQADVWVVVVELVCVNPLLVLPLLPLETGVVVVVVPQSLVLLAMAVGASAAPATPRPLTSASAAAAVRTLIRVPSYAFYRFPLHAVGFSSSRADGYGHHEVGAS